MLFESSTIASVLTVIIEAMQKSYNFDARPIISRLGVDLAQLAVPGARYPSRLIDDVVSAIQEETGDECIGLAVGQFVRPTTFHALSYAWLASSSVLDALQRLERYDRIMSTVDEVAIRTDKARCTLEVKSRSPDYPFTGVSVDAYFVAILTMCRWIADGDVILLEVRLQHADYGRAGDYTRAFGAPVVFSADSDCLVFNREFVEKPAPGGNTELARQNDHVAADYLASLDPATVAKEVRALLMQLLPSGDASQDRIAESLNRSLSTLQRALRAEGTTYSELRESTRQALASEYVRRNELSLQEVAFLLGFSDQSNFSRAFRRWTGKSPKAWRESERAGS